MLRALERTIDRIVVSGDLRLTDSKGRTRTFGDGSGTPVSARVTDARTEWSLILDPTAAIGEAYMDGRLVIERGTIYDFLETILSNIEHRSWPRHLQALEAMRFITRRVRQFNPVTRAKRNAAHHYDIDRSIYALFLDEDWQYSCAYFEHKDETLEEAQLAKKRHLAAKLALRDGLSVLDIGCGWGGLGLYLAQTARVNVSGITLSEEQLKVARERAWRTGLSRTVNFDLRDYRDQRGAYDRIVSVGMFEHVGLSHYRHFFEQVSRLLTDDGVAMLHSIGRFDGPASTNPFIAKYIFPGGYIPALSEVLRAIERCGLLVADVEILRLHYAETLRHWRRRFCANWHEAAAHKGERFCRMWEFYLAASETAFRYQNLMVFQIQMVKDQTVLPLIRDYMIDGERELRVRDRRHAPGRQGSLGS
jgi:cyclopropane-fatty-acyl-phospholipid synthase